MRFIKNLPTYILVGVLLGLLVWALFIPKSDFSEKFVKTLEDQKKRADLFFNGVTVAEISEGKKYWELTARTSALNKTTNVTNMDKVNGVFFQDGLKALKIIAPKAVWHMTQKEIYLSKPFGYDSKFEKFFAKKISDLGKLKDLNAVFNLPTRGSSGESGYWFKANNLNWKLATRKIICTNGIILTRGDLVVRSKDLEADVAMEHVFLRGNPTATINSVSLEATVIEVDSLEDIVIAEGNVLMTRPEGRITADRAVFLQSRNELDLSKNVVITFRDLNAWGTKVKYLMDNEEAVISGNARAKRGKDIITGEEISIFFKLDKVAVKGRTSVKIGKDLVTPEAQ